MLSGIRTGKKKKKRKAEEDTAPEKKRAPANTGNASAAEELRRQLASGAPLESKDKEDVVVLTGAAVASARPDYRPEDFRHGSRKGKLKRTHDETDMTIQDMVQEERSNTRSMDEVYARNVARVGSRYKGTDFKEVDDDEQVDMTMFQNQKLTSVQTQQREQSRQLAQHDKVSGITKKCWWWMESPSFRKHTMLALGNHVSMVMTPPNLSLFPGQQVYLVPIQHADSLVNCEDNVWNEISRFQSSLRSMYAKEGKDVIFWETVLPSTKGFWHTKMEAIPVSKRSCQDAPMFFKSAMTEQAEEWGTHTKLLSTRDKGLRRTIPKTFPYFNVEWGPGDGFAQIIESQNFPKDFGVDTIAGMLQMDPVRFRKGKNYALDEEKKFILDFVAKWKAFDWTLELE